MSFDQLQDLMDGVGLPTRGTRYKVGHTYTISGKRLIFTGRAKDDAPLFIHDGNVYFIDTVGKLRKVRAA